MTTPIAPTVVARFPATGFTPDTNAVIEIPTTSTITVGADVAAQASGVTVPAIVSCALVAGDGTAVELPSSPYPAWSTLCQQIPGDLLTPGTGYTLTFTYTAGPSPDTRTARIVVRCPF